MFAYQGRYKVLSPNFCVLKCLSLGEEFRFDGRRCTQFSGFTVSLGISELFVGFSAQRNSIDCIWRRNVDAFVRRGNIRQDIPRIAATSTPKQEADIILVLGPRRTLLAGTVRLRSVEKRSS